MTTTASDSTVSTAPTWWTAKRTVVALLALPAFLAVSLAGMGRVWWCEAGDLLPWSWDVWSTHNSQHFVDPYSLSHIQNGLGLYLLLTFLFGSRCGSSVRTLLVALVETTWELVENTNWMIERYRAATISLDYYGDSILNSLGDYGSCLAGVLLARRLPWQVSLAVFAALEIVSVLWIRDSLMLNILMLLCPIEAVRQWQTPG